jgi:hypothetical protein
MSNRPGAHPAAIYNEKRRIIFSTFHSDPVKARSYLQGYKQILGDKGFIGLKAELDFYEKNRNKFQLTVAADVGDCTDFTGLIGTEMVRFDVTTNENVKILSDYESHAAEGYSYKLAIVDAGSGDLVDLVDLSFPACSNCGFGRIFDIALLLGEQYLSDGGSSGIYDQAHFRLCNGCQSLQPLERISTVGLLDLEAAVTSHCDAGEASSGAEFDSCTYLRGSMRYLKKEMGANVVAVASNRYVITDPRNADGFWETYIPYVRPIARNQFPLEFGGLWCE